MRILFRDFYLGLRLAILLLALTACASPGTHTSTNTDTDSGYRKVINHPGNIELIYYGFQIDNPAYFKTRVNNKEIFVTKDAVIPSIQSVFLLEHTRINVGDVVLDIGTGSGVQAIFAAQQAKYVVATDINPNAVTSARYNIKYHGLQEKIDVRLGDLFSPIKDDEQFDVIIYNIDYPFDVEANELWEVHERFFAQVKKYLKPDGTIFYQAGWIWNIPRILDMIRSNGFLVERINMAAADNHDREPIVFELKYNLKKGGK